MMRVIVLLVIWPGNTVYAIQKHAGEKAPLSLPTVDYFQWSGGLILVLALIFCLLWLLRKIGGVRTMPGGQLKVLGGVALGTRERAVLLKVGRKNLLVGVSPGRLQTLCELEDEDLSEILGQTGKGGQQSLFKDHLHQVLGK